MPSTIQQRITALAKRYAGKGLTEQDTKNALIEPVLADFGWPKEDLERVRAEFRPTSKYNPVDYALLSRGRPVLFVEAKALDVSINEHKAIQQVLSYATVAGVDWALITNGKQWDLYAVFARVAAPEKRFFSTSIDADEFTEWMNWIRPERLEGNDLERLWRLLVAERQVKHTLIRLLNERNDALLSLLSKETSLDTADVAMALQALQPSFASMDMGDWDKIVSQTSRPALKPLKTPPKRASTTLEALPKPQPGSKPRLLCIENQEYKVTSWRSMLMHGLEHIAREHPQHFKRLLDAPELQGRTRRYMSKTSENMHTPVKMAGGFIESNMSARKVVAVLSTALQLSEISLHTVTYEVDSPPTSTQ